MKYLKNFPDHNDYSAFIIGSDFKDIQAEKKDVVSYCKNQSEIHYNPYIAPPALLDILYSDASGNLSYTSKVLPVSEGKTPIGLCIAGTGFFGDNEPARWMSLKHMNYTTPETGSLTSQGMYWGNNNNDISTINNIQYTYKKCGGCGDGYLAVDYYDNSTETHKIPSILNENNEWNISVLGAVNQYVVTDIDGKNKTTKILVTATGQPTWQTDISITNTYEANYAPAACCCARYHTLGTSAGDWYLGACGEMCMILVNKTDINTKLATINTIYTNDCINSLSNYYFTSTEYDNSCAYSIDTVRGKISYGSKGANLHILAMLQY